jgi:hypothetical protein
MSYDQKCPSSNISFKFLLNISKKSYTVSDESELDYLAQQDRRLKWQNFLFFVVLPGTPILLEQKVKK